MQSAIDYLRLQLSPRYPVGEVKAITRLLLEEVCHLSRTQQLAHPDLQLTDEQHARLREIADRMASGEPVQHVLGYEWFAGRRFEVTRDTLIPRPETAELVELILADHRDDITVTPDHGLRLLDVGTGSGCIAITLATALPQAEVTALDVSAAALAVAERNAQQLQVPGVRFVQADVLQLAANASTAAANDTASNLGQFDLIVSNPPYIRQSEAAEMETHVLDFEPHTALFVPDADPLLFYRAIAQWGCTALRGGGRLYFEINAALGGETCQLLAELGYQHVALRQDSFGRDRMVSCTLP